MNLRERFTRWKAAEGAKLRPMSPRQRAGYILHYYRFWLMGLVLLLAVGFYIGDAVVQSQKEILLQGFFTNNEYNLFPAENIQKDYAATQALTRRQLIVFDDALYIDLGGDASDYTSASNGKLIAYTLTHELDFVVTSDEVLAYYKDNMPMRDLGAKGLAAAAGQRPVHRGECRGQNRLCCGGHDRQPLCGGHRRRCRLPGGAHLLSVCAGKRTAYPADHRISALCLPAGMMPPAGRQCGVDGFEWPPLVLWPSSAENLF